MNRRSLLKTSAATAGLIGCGALTNCPIGPRASSAADSDQNENFDEITDHSRRAIERGTNWLIKAINKDGGAGLDIANPSDVACTSVVGIALLSQGSTPAQGDLSFYQKRIAQFLLNRVENIRNNGSLQASQSIIEGDLGPLATHFFAMIYLGQIVGEAPDIARYMRAAQRLEQFISNNQLNNGSWGDNAWAPMLGTACGWVSLRAANFCGLKVSGSCDKAGDYMVRTMPSLPRNWVNSDWYHAFYGTAAGLRVLYSLQREEEDKAKKGLKEVMKLVSGNGQAFGGAGGEEYLTFHLLTEMLMQKGGDQWQTWYTTVRDKLLKVQNRDGSWTGHHCITSRTFSTACALMVLTAPNRYLPISQV